MDQNISEKFDSAATSPDRAGPSSILNYVWISKKPAQPEDSPHICQIPLGYFDKAYANARLYPDTPVNIWVDGGAMDLHSRYFLHAHAFHNAPGNVHFQELRDIPAYRERPLYGPDSKASLWNKVDLARFIVLDHVMSTTGADTAYYSDFDVEDVRIGGKATLAKITDRGLAFGKLPLPEAITHYFLNDLSPGYIAVGRNGAQQLKEKLLPDLMAAADSGRTVVLRVFTALHDHFARGDETMSQALKALQSDLVMYPAGRVMPENPAYAAMALCPSNCR